MANAISVPREGPRSLGANALFYLLIVATLSISTATAAELKWQTLPDTRSFQLCVVGTETLVRRALLDQLEEAGANYLLCQLAFGDLPLDASQYTALAIQSGIMDRVD